MQQQYVNRIRHKQHERSAGVFHELEKLPFNDFAYCGEHIHVEGLRDDFHSLIQMAVPDYGISGIASDE
jgi:hypothetical protein